MVGPIVIFHQLGQRQKIQLNHTSPPKNQAKIASVAPTLHAKNKRTGKQGLAALKLDMSKAYDRVEWSFLESIMKRMGFQNEWINLVMKCVRTVTHKIKVNDKYTETSQPRRGLHQGDPLSPYLFSICVEGLSVLLEDAERRCLIEGVRICHGAPRINHLFFADDSLIFIKSIYFGGQTLTTYSVPV